MTLWLLWLLIGSIKADNLTCKAQDGLPLSQPYTPPYFLRSALPLCSQYTCSCCNQSHASSLYRALRAALEDPRFGKACAAWQRRMACRVCDPEVGTGLKPAVCRSACDAWYAACAGEYFAFDTLSPLAGGLVPCTEELWSQQRARPGAGPGAEGEAGFRSLLCSRLGEVVAGGAELCREAGFPVAADEGSADELGCFDGNPAYRTDMCVEAPARPQARTRQRQQPAADGRSGAGYMLGCLLVAGLMWAGLRLLSS